MIAKLKSRFVAGAAIAARASAAPSFTAAQGFVIDKYRIEPEDCLGCATPFLETTEDVQQYMASVDAAMQAFDNDDIPIIGNDAGDSRDAQLIYLNFDAGGEPTFPVCNSDGTLFGIFDDYVYSPDEIATIAERIERDFADFDYEVTTTQPPAGAVFTEVRFGDNDAPLDCSQGSNITVTPTGGVSILFGQAQGIDFLNQIRNDTSFADASFWTFLVQLDPSGGLFEAFSGISLSDFSGNILLALSQAVVNQSSNTGAHEVAHNLGLRHQNSFGPPGQGLPTTGTPSPFDFVPVFDGPVNGTETVQNLMATGASVGLSLTGSTITDRNFSERSAVRLAMTEQTWVRTEAGIVNNNLGRRAVELTPIDVPNTIVNGQNTGADIVTRGLVIEGDLSAEGEVDTYDFTVKQGEFVNAELISVIGNGLTFEEGILGQLRLYRIERDGSQTLVASNLQSFESFFDAEIFDALLPRGRYRIEVSAPNEFFPVDFDGDGALDAVPLVGNGGDDLLAGSYSLLLYTCKKVLDDTPPPPGEDSGTTAP